MGKVESAKPGVLGLGGNALVGGAGEGPAPRFLDPFIGLIQAAVAIVLGIARGRVGGHLGQGYAGADFGVALLCTLLLSIGKYLGIVVGIWLGILPLQSYI